MGLVWVTVQHGLLDHIILLAGVTSSNCFMTALAAPTNNWECQSEVSINVLVHGCKLPRVAGVGITAVEKSECRLRVHLNDRLCVSQRG